VGDVHVPDSITVFHVPDFKGAAISLAMTSGDFAPCKKLFLESNWIPSKLRRHVEIIFPKLGKLILAPAFVTHKLFKMLVPFCFRKDAFLPLLSS
jgi:hypothetical protein